MASSLTIPEVLTQGPGARVQATVPEVNPGRGLKIQAQQVRTEMREQERVARERVDRVRFLDARRRAQKELHKYINDPAEGFIHIKGERALAAENDKGLVQRYDEKVQKVFNDIRRELGTDDQRAAFDAWALEAGGAFNKAINTHVASEFEAFEKDTYEAERQAAVERASVEYSNPQALAEVLRDIEAATEYLLEGAPEQAKANEIKATQSKAIVMAVVSAVDDGLVPLAKYIFETYEQAGMLDKASRESIKEVLTAGDNLRKVQETTDTLYQKHEGDVRAALEENRATNTGELRDEVETRLLKRDANRVELRERTAEDAMDKLWNLYNESGNINAAPVSVLKEAEPKSKELAALRKTIKEDAKAARAKKPVETSPDTYYDLLLLSTQPQFTYMNLREYFPALSKEHREYFSKLQKGAIENASKVAPQIALNSLIDSTAGSLGIKKEDKYLFALETQKEFIRMGGQLDDEEQLRLVGRMVKKHKSGDYYFEVQAEGEEDSFEPDWSDADQAKARGALIERGIKHPTKTQLNDYLYREYFE